MNIFKRIIFAFRSYDNCRAADKMINDLYDSIYCLKNECELLRKDAKMALFKYLSGETIYCVIDRNKVPSDANSYIINKDSYNYIKDYRIYKFTVKHYVVDNHTIYITIEEVDFDKHKFKIEMNDNRYIFKDIDFAINFMRSNNMIECIT